MRAHQFDVFPNPDSANSESHPYFMVLQTNSLEHLNTRVVAPLIPPKTLPFFERLMPEVSVEGSRFVLDITNIGVLPVRLLHTAVVNLEADRYRIISAIDLVFTGI
jgi:toxin CcdB